MFILPLGGLGVNENISYEEVLVEILDRQFKKLWNKEVAYQKVIWTNQLFEGAKCEDEDYMKSLYSHLFPLKSSQTLGL